MSLLSWILFTTTALAAAGFAAWVYRRREPPVAGSGLLAGLRGGVLVLLLLLLWNPSIPAGDLPGGRPDVVLLDTSLSMSATGADGSSSWSRAVGEAARREDAGERVLSFGGEGGPPGIPAGGAVGITSRLGPALERAAELGAREVTILSDLRLEDPAEAAATARRLGVEPGVVPLGEPVVNAGVAELDLPRSAARSDTLTALVAIFGEGGGGGDSVTVEIREEERLVGARRVLLPDPGRVARLSLLLPPPAESGGRLYSARVLLEGDGFPDDDERLAAVAVDADEGGLVLLSLRPDFEPRFLLPLLRDVTGLPTRGYLALAAGGFLAMDVGPSGNPAADPEVVRRAVAGADLLVLHGLGRGAPEWVREGAEAAPRLLLLPRDPEGAAPAGVAALAPVVGEWMAVPDLPPSPLAPELAGVSLANLPPLDALLPVAPETAGEVPLRGQLQGRGAGEPLLLLRDDGERRRAVALATGFWRWGFREGAPREAYRRLWSGVAGWLLSGRAVAGGEGVRPSREVLGRGEAPLWLAPATPGARVRLEAWLLDTPGVPAMDTVVTIGEDGRVRTEPLPPGRYGWRAGPADPEGEVEPGEAQPGEIVAAEGRLFVESWVPELMHPRADLATEIASVPAGEAAGGAGRGGRPLRTHPAPFLLLLALLCGEWIGRRRQGLR